MFLFLLAWVAVTPSLNAQETTEAMTNVEVVGVLPGPGFWQVSNGTNSLWILATVRPTPKRMEWETIKLERKLSQSQALLFPVSVSLNADVGFFAKIGLIPSLLRARKNPDGKTLKDVLPADIYARWLIQKEKYIGKDKDIEYWRPIFVAQKLYQEAVKKAGLNNESIVWPVVNKNAKKLDLPIIQPEIKIQISDPKKFIKEFSARTLNDTACFDKTLRSIEVDVRNMSRRGTLWAEGKVSELESMTFEDYSGACVEAVLGSGSFQNSEMQNLPERMNKAWLDAAELALKNNVSTVAVVVMSDLLESDGFLAQLRAKGYTITAPVDNP